MTMQRMILVSDCLIERLTTIVRVFGVTGPERDSSQLAAQALSFFHPSDPHIAPEAVDRRLV